MKTAKTGLLAACAVVVATMGVPAMSVAAPGGQGGGKPVVGARSLGDPLLPQLGNGGYDVQHYTIKLDYDPVANRFNSAKTTIVAIASEKLQEFSLDFQDDLEVRSVTVDRRDADFRFEVATPQLSDDPVVTQPMKLVVTRAHPRDRWPDVSSPSSSSIGDPRSRSPTPTRRSRGGSRRASRSIHPARATVPSSSTSRWVPRAGSRRTTTRPTRRRSTRSSPCPTARRRSGSASSSNAPTTATGRAPGTGTRTTRPRRTSRRRPSATSRTRWGRWSRRPRA